MRRDIATLSVALVDHGVKIAVRRPRESAPRTRRLHPGEEQAILNAMRNGIVRDAFLLALETACRRSELLGLRWRNVNLESRIISVTGKTGERLVALSSRAAEVLDNRDKNSAIVFPMTMLAFRSEWVRTLRRAGSDFHFHDCRREAISRWFEHGLSVGEAMQLTGHKSTNGGC